jgi:hypothetical protein
MRPRRVYKNTKGRYYYLVNGKKKYIKTPKDMTDRKIVNINIKTYQPPSTSKKRKRRTKRRTMKYGSKVAGDMVPLERKTTGVVSQQLPTYLFEPGKQVDTFLSKRDREKELRDELKDLKLLTYVKPEVSKPELKRLTYNPPKSRDDESTMDMVESESDSTDRVGDFRRTGKLVKLVLPSVRSFLTSLPVINDDTARYDIYKKYVRANDDYENIKNIMESERGNRDIQSVFRLARSDVEQRMRGSGDDGSKALWNDELEKILKKKIKNDYVPVIPSDKTNDLLEHVYEGMPDFSFIINTAPSTSDGSTDGHWRAVYIDNNDDYKTIEYYDSLVSRPEKTLIDIMRKIAKIINPETTFLYKQNNLKNQSDSTDTCGYFAVRFLELRNNGVPFSEATGYDDYIAKHKPDASMEGEGKINEVVKIYNSYI